MIKPILLVPFLAIAVFANVAVTSAATPPTHPKVGLSAFYDLLALEATAVDGAVPGVALVDEETCTTTVSTQPSVFSGNILLNCNSLGIRNEMTVAVNPTNPKNIVAGSHRYKLILEGSSVNVHVVSAAYVTLDGGETWTNVIPPFGGFQFWGDPALAFDSRGRVYYALIADHEGQNGLFTNVSVIVYRSDDGGLTWQGPVVVSAGNGGVVGPQDFNDKVYLAVDSSLTSPFRDRVYVTWTRFLAGPRGAYIESPIYESHSDDGANWSVAKEISGSNAQFCTFQFGDQETGVCDEDQGSQPAVGPDGTVYVAFENFNTPADNQMLMVRSKNGGASWQGPFFLTTVADGPGRYPTNSDGRDTLTGCQLRVNARGSLAVDQGSGVLYLVWDDNRKGTASLTNVDVFLVRSSDQGSTWKMTTVSSILNDQFYPWVAVGPRGQVVVGYMDRQYQPSNAQCQYGFTLSVSKNGGKTFSNQRVDTGLSRADNSRFFGKNTRFIGDYNGVAVGSDGVAWAVWTDMRADVTFLGTTRAGQDTVAARVSL